MTAPSLTAATRPSELRALAVVARTDRLRALRTRNRLALTVADHRGVDVPEQIRTAILGPIEHEIVVLEKLSAARHAGTEPEVRRMIEDDADLVVELGLAEEQRLRNALALATLEHRGIHVAESLKAEVHDGSRAIALEAAADAWATD